LIESLVKASSFEHQKQQESKMSSNLIDFRKMVIGSDFGGTKVVTCPVCKQPGLGFTYSKVNTIRFVHTAIQEPITGNESRKYNLHHRAYHSTPI
jgi:hypothetical protein